MRPPVPRLARWLLSRISAAEHRVAMLADIDEEAAARAELHGIAAARRWSRRQVIGSVLPLLLERLQAAASYLRRISMDVLRGLRSDLTLAVRRLIDAPGFSLICIATLALGIGGNTAVFTLIDRVMLKPLPVQRPSELHRVGDTDACCVNGGLMGSFSLFSYDLYLRLRQAAPEFTELAAFQANTRSITVGRPDADTPPQTFIGVFVSGNYFQMLELVPAAGRLIQPTDDARGAAPAAVISYRAWRERFQGRADVIGAPTTLNGVAAVIVGVAPPGFYGEMMRVPAPEIWVPLASEPLLQPASRLLEATTAHWLYALGRLKPGTPLEPLKAKLTNELRHWIGENVTLRPDDRDELARQYINVIPAPGGVNNLRDEVAPALRLLQGLAAAVLLIACANLASLLLARGMTRRTETAVRAALGASRTRLVSQFLVDSVLLACLGGVVGLALSYAASRAIVDLAFRGEAVDVNAVPSLVAVGFAFAISLLTGIVFGVAPAIVGSRSAPIEALRGAGRVAGERATRLRQSLIALQVAMSLVLVTSAGLLTRSLQKLEAQDFGFKVDGRYVVDLAPSFTMVPPAQMESTYTRLRERLRRIPGVVNAAFSLYAPMSGDNWSHNITVDGHDPAERNIASWARVSPGYFDTIGTPVIRGRAFDERDGPGAPLVAVVSQTFATRLFGDADPIGKRIGSRTDAGAATRDFEIIGVVGDVKYQDGRRPPYTMYFVPFLQLTAAAREFNKKAGIELDRSHYAQALELQTAGRLPGLEAEVRRALAEVDRRITVRTLTPMDEQIARGFNLERLIARLTTSFGAVALLLACLGLYGVTAYSVTRRTREIGIRMAIGATQGRVVAAILRSALLQLAAGIVLGLPAALIAGRLLRARLFGVSTHDPIVAIGGLTLLVLCNVLAAWVPARRAAGLDPVRALRNE